jgi:hypothetical protein
MRGRRRQILFLFAHTVLTNSDDIHDRSECEGGGDSCKPYERSNRADRAADKSEQRLDHEDPKQQENVGEER